VAFLRFADVTPVVVIWRKTSGHLFDVSLLHAEAMAEHGRDAIKR
jgi:hypothetical protein